MTQLRGKTLIRYKEGLQLSKAQKALVIGSVLGDGSLRIPGRNREANFIVDQGEAQKDYVFWKYERMKEWVLTPPKKVVRIYHKDKTRKTISWRFLTVAHQEFTELYRLFYQNRKKVMPSLIGNLLVHLLSLEVWAMDDGSKSRNSFFLNTQNFTRK